MSKFIKLHKYNDLKPTEKSVVSETLVNTEYFVNAYLDNTCYTKNNDKPFCTIVKIMSELPMYVSESLEEIESLVQEKEYKLV